MRVIPILMALMMADVSCGTGSQVAVAPPTAQPAISPATPTANPAPSTPSVPTPTPTPAPASQPPVGTFDARVAPAGADVRTDPGTDADAVATLLPGMTATFDGWFRRTDSEALPDAVTRRIERWSRDWFRLAGGLGWVSSAQVIGFQPPGMPQVSWVRPTSLPHATTLVLPIEWRHQEQAATCEAAALRAALTLEGIRVTEGALLDIVGVDRRDPVLDDSGRLIAWGDPDDAFVGDPDGHPGDYSGYGVYAGPVARAATTVGGTVLSSGRNIDPEEIYAALLAGHPVVAWVTVDYRPTHQLFYRAFDGHLVKYSLLEHAVTLTGVSPDSVLITDPARSQSWHSRDEFEAGYEKLDEMAVILE